MIVKLNSLTGPVIFRWSTQRDPTISPEELFCM